MRYIVDTNIWIRLLRKEKRVGSAMRAALARGDEILLTSIVYFELLRGLEKRQDFASIRFIRMTLGTPGFAYQECSQPVWDAAIGIWVQASGQNKLQEDADIIIAAFAVHLKAAVVTENAKHFSSLGVNIENWT